MASKLASSEAELSKFLSIFSLTIKQSFQRDRERGDESECIMYNIKYKIYIYRGGRGTRGGRGLVQRMGAARTSRMIGSEQVQT